MVDKVVVTHCVIIFTFNYLVFCSLLVTQKWQTAREFLIKTIDTVKKLLTLYSHLFGHSLCSSMDFEKGGRIKGVWDL